MAGELVRARGQSGHERNADHVTIGVQIQGFHVLIHDPHRMFARGQRRHNRQRQHAKAQHRPPGHLRMFPRHPHPFARRQH